MPHDEINSRTSKVDIISDGPIVDPEDEVWGNESEENVNVQEK